MDYNYSGNAIHASGSYATSLGSASVSSPYKLSPHNDKEHHPLCDLNKLNPACRCIAGYIDRPDITKRKRQRLTHDQVLSIRARYAEAKPEFREAKPLLLAICKEDGIGYKTATDIISRRTWANL